LKQDSIRNIARKAGVSPITASRILRDQHQKYRDETVARVREAAREVGYRPNLLARSILGGRTQTVGVMIAFSHSSFTSNELFGIHDALIERDYAPLMLIARPNQTTVLEQIHRLLDRRVDGIILGQGQESTQEEDLRDVWKRQVPLVAVHSPLKGTRHAGFVATDEAVGGRLALRHLVEQGHRRIGYVTWRVGYGNLIAREKAFLGEAAAYPEIQCEVVEVSAAASPQGTVEMLDFLKRPDRPTALALGGDTLARGVYQAAFRLGIRIPEDLSVIGFSDHEFSRHMDPPLTTVHEFPYEIGRKAVELILNRIERDGEEELAPESVLIPPELLVRGSTSSPAYESGKMTGGAPVPHCSGQELKGKRNEERE